MTTLPLLVTVLLVVSSSQAAPPGTLALSPPPAGTHFEFGGVVGERIKADIDNWLIPAPKANPGMTEMFQVRDRKPVPELVPWAGEFVGKYLISAIQALRMSDSKELRATVEDVIKRTIAGQDEDGYLGPFRHEERLLGQWDLWGHYHIIQAMLMWHEDTGDEAAFECAKKMGDFICKVYLNTDKRPINAGSTEMNLAIIHGLGKLYRATNDQKYLDMMRVVEKDWEKAGDYFRQGLADVPFYKIPSPRWESLHDLQGLGELYRITGNEDYKTAYVNLWRSIRKYDRHNTGGFSTGEQAIGNPFTPGAIETCCTTAWSAITKDILELTGDPGAADELELSFYNSILGSQHPSGRWFTYNTPMDGKREASAHTIVFQSRAGTPELNCCSVNGPRGLGMLSEWAITQGPPNTYYVNYLGPMKVSIPKADGHTLTITVESKYPAEGHIRVLAHQDGGDATPIFIRFPRWASGIKLETLSVDPVAIPLTTIGLGAGKSDSYTDLDISMEPRVWRGDGAQLGKAAIYRGPLLLAFDQHDNAFDVSELSPIDLSRLVLEPVAINSDYPASTAWTVATANGKKAVLRDYASAGAAGTEYISWLPVSNAPPPDFQLETPSAGAKVPVGPTMFKWNGSDLPEGSTYTLEVADKEDFNGLLFHCDTQRPWQVMRNSLQDGKTYFWRVRARNATGETVSMVPELADQLPVGVSPDSFRASLLKRVKPIQLPLALSFTIDASLKNDFTDNPATYEFRDDNLITGDALDGKAAPVYGYVDAASGVSPTPDRNGKTDGALAFNGHDGMVRYRTPGFPGDNYTVSVWFKMDAAQPHLAQVFSAWSKGGDDPLRIAVEGEAVYVRIEGNSGANTKGAPVALGQWTHACAVKAGGTLKFYVNGALIDTTGAPGIVPTLSKDIALGSNPHHSGDEHFNGAIDDFACWARALSEEEVKALAAGTLKLDLPSKSN